MGHISEMNESDRAELKGLISARLEEIAAENALGEDGQAVVALDQQSVGRLSRMDALQAQAMAKAQQGLRDGEAARLKAALARMGEDEYGFCEDCGEEIAVARLRLNPAAPKCISCARG